MALSPITCLVLGPALKTLSPCSSSSAPYPPVTHPSRWLCTALPEEAGLTPQSPPPPSHTHLGPPHPHPKNGTAWKHLERQMGEPCRLP